MTRKLRDGGGGPPNGWRLSCGALLPFSQTDGLHTKRRRQLQARVRRHLLYPLACARAHEIRGITEARRATDSSTARDRFVRSNTPDRHHAQTAQPSDPAPVVLIPSTR